MEIGTLLDQFFDDGEKFRLKSVAAKSSRFSEEISLSEPILATSTQFILQKSIFVCSNFYYKILELKVDTINVNFLIMRQ